MHHTRLGPEEIALVQFIDQDVKLLHLFVHFGRIDRFSTIGELL